MVVSVRLVLRSLAEFGGDCGRVVDSFPTLVVYFTENRGRCLSIWSLRDDDGTITRAVAVTSVSIKRPTVPVLRTPDGHNQRSCSAALVGQVNQTPSANTRARWGTCVQQRSCLGNELLITFPLPHLTRHYDTGESPVSGLNINHHVYYCTALRGTRS